MFQPSYSLVQTLQLFLVPLCFVAAWTLTFLVLWNLWASAKYGITTVKRLHQIPCANCRFFTGNYYLKCTVHPSRALSEAAINCPDYGSKDQ